MLEFTVAALSLVVVIISFIYTWIAKEDLRAMAIKHDVDSQELQSRLNDLESEFDGLQSKVEDLESEQAWHKQAIDDVEQSIINTEHSLSNEIGELRNDLESRSNHD